MSTRIYIGRLSYDVRERDIEKFFKGFGKIREILLKNGFGFVEFDDYQDADDAVYELNGKTLLGERVTIEHARGSPRGTDVYRERERSRYRPPPPSRAARDKYGPPTRTEYRVTVENLSSRVSWQDLKDYMRQAGEVTYADAHKQRRNEGVVEFASYSDMKNAIDKLDDTDLSGRRIKMVRDRSSRRRSRSRDSRSRSRRRSSSRSESRSRSRKRSRSPSKSRKSRTPSKSRRSRTPSKSRRSRTPSKSRRSRTPSKSRRSRSPSKSRRSRTPSKSRRSRTPVKARRGRTPSESRSRSRSKSLEKRSMSPVRRDGDASNSADDN